MYLFPELMLYLDLFTEICSHRPGSDNKIEGDSAQAHIHHNIAFSHRGEHRHKSEIMSITY